VDVRTFSPYQEVDVRTFSPYQLIPSQILNSSAFVGGTGRAHLFSWPELIPCRAHPLPPDRAYHHMEFVETADRVSCRLQRRLATEANFVVGNMPLAKPSCSPTGGCLQQSATSFAGCLGFCVCFEDLFLCDTVKVPSTAPRFSSGFAEARGYPPFDLAYHHKSYSLKQRTECLADGKGGLQVPRRLLGPHIPPSIQLITTCNSLKQRTECLADGKGGLRVPPANGLQIYCNLLHDMQLLYSSEYFRQDPNRFIDCSG